MDVIVVFRGDREIGFVLSKVGFILDFVNIFFGR